MAKDFERKLDEAMRGSPEHTREVEYGVRPPAQKRVTIRGVN